MRKDLIKEGGVYIARVSGAFVPVLVKQIIEGHPTPYICVNLDTHRTLRVRSAQRFRLPCPFEYGPTGMLLVRRDGEYAEVLNLARKMYDAPGSKAHTQKLMSILMQK